MIGNPLLELLPDADQGSLPMDVSWATVITARPLVIRMEGATEPLESVPGNITGPLFDGARVLVLKKNHRYTILGVGRGTSDWKPIPIASGFVVHDSATPQYCIRNGMLCLLGMIKPATGTFTTSYSLIIPSGGLPWISNFIHAQRSAKILASAGGSPPMRSYMTASGGLQVAATSGTPAYVSLASEYPIGLA